MKAGTGVRALLDVESPPLAGEMSAVEPSARGAAVHLLVVDPAPGWSGKLAALLPPGEMVTTFCTGAEALETAGRICPDVVLVWLLQPYEEGARLLGVLPEVVPRAGLVVIDSWPTMASALKALRLGAYAYLPWPQAAAKLTSRIKGAHKLGLLLTGLGVHPGSSRGEPHPSPEPLPALAA